MASQRSDAARCAMGSAAGVGAVVLTAHGCNQLVFVPSTAGETSLRGSLASGSRPGQVAQRGAVHKGMTSDMAAVSAALGLCGASALAVMAKRRRFNSRCVELYVSSPEQPKSLAIPFAPVPSNLTNNPLDKVFPGDLGFDPLGMSTYEGKYVDEVLQNFDATFDRMRWYREAELMHGRVAMLASLNLLLRETALSPILPDQLLEAEALTQLVQTMAMLEAYRGWRLFFNTDQIAGDLGLGSLQGPSAEELALRQYKELQNGRLAMVAIVAMAAQYQATGRAVGIDESQVQQQVQMVGNYLVGLASIPGQQQEAFEQAWPFLLGLLGIDGIRRLSTPSQDKAENEIAQKSLNIAKLSFGVQDPALSLPAGVSAGQAPQTLSLTEEQVVEFEDNGVIIIRGAMKEWVNFLQKTTEHQIENPHIWSLVGRMSGLYDYIQRNTWMTNNGFRDFIYYSPLGHIISQLGRTEEVRVTTDMLLVNPNRGFGWHQDNQNGPIDFPNAIRWWVAMDKCGENDYGAPEYILGSHRNATVADDAVFVEREAGDLGSYQKTAKYVCQPGDLIIWDARTIHRIIAPPGQCWEEGTQRRAIGGTVAKAGARYFNKGGASSISDLAGHEQQNGDMLGGPYFPRIWPNRVPEEAQVREQGRILGRSPKKMLELASTLAANAGKYVSFTKVLGKRA